MWRWVSHRSRWASKWKVADNAMNNNNKLQLVANIDETRYCWRWKKSSMSSVCYMRDGQWKGWENRRGEPDLECFSISIEESKLHSKRTWGPSGKGGIWHCLSTPAFQGWLFINFLRNVSRTLGKYFINVSFLTRHWNLLVDKYSPVFLFIRVYN